MRKPHISGFSRLVPCVSHLSCALALPAWVTAKTQKEARQNPSETDFSRFLLRRFSASSAILQRCSSRTQWPNGPAMTPLRLPCQRNAQFIIHHSSFIIGNTPLHCQRGDRKALAGFGMQSRRLFLRCFFARPQSLDVRPAHCHSLRRWPTDSPLLATD